MTGRHHAISEFLVENVLDTLEPSMLDFLLATSITERISGDLAAALSCVPDSQAMLEQVEERDLFLHRIDEQWFRYHQLFLDFLRHRLDRDEPERVVRLHRVASTWFAEHRMVSEAVDHALAAGDDQRAVQLVENDGIYLVANSQMATLIGLVGKLPAAVVRSDPRLQLALAWANIVLHRIPAAEQALTLMESRLGSCGLSDDEIADLRAEGGVVRGVADLRSDRLAGIDEHIAPCLARRDHLRPFAVGVAATVSTFAAAYRYDLDEVNRIQAWAAPYAERNSDTFNAVNGLCYTGIAHRLMLDIPRRKPASARHSRSPSGPAAVIPTPPGWRARRWANCSTSEAISTRQTACWRRATSWGPRAARSTSRSPATSSPPGSRRYRATGMRPVNDCTRPSGSRGHSH